MTHKIQVGDLVEPKGSYAKRILWESTQRTRPAPNHGLVTNILSDQIVRVLWDDMRWDRPVNVRLVRKVDAVGG